MPTAKFAIKVETTNDTNGRPRRGWLVYEHPGRCLGFVDEGYAGPAALSGLYPEFGDKAQAVVTCVLEVTPREWRRVNKVQQERDAFVKKAATELLRKPVK